MIYLVKSKSYIVAISHTLSFLAIPPWGMSLGHIEFSSTRIIAPCFTELPSTSESLALSVLLNLHTSSIYCFDPLSPQYSKFVLLNLRLWDPGLTSSVHALHLSCCLFYASSHVLICFVPLFNRVPFPATCISLVPPLLQEAKCLNYFFLVLWHNPGIIFIFFLYRYFFLLFKLFLKFFLLEKAMFDWYSKAS